MKKNIFKIILVSTILFSIACGTDIGTILPSPFQTQDSMIIIGGDLNHAGVAQYDMDGNFLQVVTNFRVAGGYVRGAAAFDSYSFLVTMDNGDRIEQVSLDGTVETFYGSNLLNGNIYDIEYGENGFYYVIESNGIEVFSVDGVRDVTRYIPTTVGSCVLSTARGSTIGSNGYLYVVNTGSSDYLNIYDISTVPATCVGRAVIGQNPVEILEHSDGYFYISRQGNDTIVRVDADGGNLTAVWATNLTFINNPSAIVEHPSGDLIIASTATDSIERITTAGDRVGNVPYIKDNSSLNINDIIFIQGVE